ncbi:MAG: NAD-dependent epimerase/dehydratase family protein [Chloroflexota bacterium]
MGYIGAQLAADLLAAGGRVVGLENYFSTDATAVRALARRPGFTLLRGSIANPTALERAFGAAPIETAFLLAAQASASPDAAPARYTESTNLLAPRLFLEAATAHGVRSVVYASSMRIYGDLDPRRAVECDCFGRFGDLSHLSKVYAEKLLEMFSVQHGLRGRSVRLGLTYGVSPVMKTDPLFMTAPNRFCQQAVRGQRLAVSESGLRPQALIHVVDAATALRLAGELVTEAPYLALNAATEVATILEVARLVADEAERRALTVRIEAPAAGDTNQATSGTVPGRLAENGWQAKVGLRQGVSELLEYFQAREAGR